MELKIRKSDISVINIPNRENGKNHPTKQNNHFLESRKNKWQQ